jgi:5,10-methenyltetrahydrofolate synthetase
MVEDRYGIHIPARGAALRPDAILMPLNAFDAAGYRLGYGGGYFDRSLAALSPRPRAVGVGFELARIDSIRPQAHDLPMDFIVTEAGGFEVRGGCLKPR